MNRPPRRHGVWSFVIAAASSTALLTLLSAWDSNGFDAKKDLPKLGVVLLTVLAEWIRNRDSAT